MLPPQQPPTWQFKYKHTIRGLDVLQAVFAFIMALGLREVFVGSHDFFTVIVFGDGPLLTEKKIFFLLLFFNVLLLAMRFFWTPRNLRHLISEAAGGPGSKPDLAALSNAQVSLHTFVILVHGMIFYMIGTEVEFISFMMSSSAPLDPSIFSGYILMHLSLLIINFSWIGFIEYRKAEIVAQRAGAVPVREEASAQIWFRNNFICSVLALGPFVVVVRCGTDVLRCAESSALLPAPLFPSSPAVVSAVYTSLADLVRWAGSFIGSVDAGGPLALLLWVLGVLLFNSVLDLWRTGKYYLVLEEIEWERAPKISGQGEGASSGDDRA